MKRLFISNWIQENISTFSNQVMWWCILLHTLQCSLSLVLSWKHQADTDYIITFISVNARMWNLLRCLSFCDTHLSRTYGPFLNCQHPVQSVINDWVVFVLVSLIRGFFAFPSLFEILFKEQLYFSWRVAYKFTYWETILDLLASKCYGEVIVKVVDLIRRQDKNLVF